MSSIFIYLITRLDPIHELLTFLSILIGSGAFICLLGELKNDSTFKYSKRLTILLAGTLLIKVMLPTLKEVSFILQLEEAINKPCGIVMGRVSGE